MIKSMTAYAKSDKVEGTLSVSVEIRSYNSRHLDIALRLTHGYVPLEEKIKKFISQYIHRGRIEISVTIKDESEDGAFYEIDLPRAKAYHRSLVTLKKALGIETPLTLENIISGSGLLKPVDNEKDLTFCWQVVSEVLDTGLKDLDTMRVQEGINIAEDFEKRLDLIETFFNQIKEASKGLLEIYRNRLNERIGALTKGIVDLEPERIALEAAILADKSDISEELVRVESHLMQYRNFMTDSEPAGRKLNFLLQEFNREFNTMGSKAGKSDISHLIVATKAEIEKLREQVQNVE
ncbi:MAG: YicC/YloC family endoribonuclease [Desulfobacteraceae bacterium]|jgi:uncharacterized protein (TIGR00255 family)